MTTVEERREVTRRLRECRSGWSSGECYYTIIHALGLPDTSREDGGAALYARLADLIEPSCDAAATRTDATATRDVSQCRRSDVDRDALLALAEEIEAGFRLECSTGPAHMVVDLVNIEMGKLAHRIREACGEVEHGE